MYYDITTRDDGTPQLNVYFNIFHWMGYCERNNEALENYRSLRIQRNWNDYKFEMMHDCIVRTFHCQRLFVKLEDESIQSNVYSFFCNPLLHKHCNNSICVLYPYVGGILDGYDENNNLE